MNQTESKVVSIAASDIDSGYTAWLTYLAERGLTEAQAVANGITPCYDSDPKAQTIATVRQHFKANRKLPGALIDHGNNYYTFRYLCDDDQLPRDVNTGKPKKLVCPSGKSVRTFLPPSIEWDALPEGTKVYICEAAIKSVAVVVSGKVAVGLNGAGGWSRDHRLHPDLINLFKIKKLLPVILLDANAHEGPAFNTEVAKSQAALVAALYNACDVAEVEVVRLPCDGAYDQGVDDFFAKGGTWEELDQVTYTVDADGTPSIAATSLDDFMEATFRVPEPIVEGYISLGECNLLTSAPKCGKTRTALTAALQIAAGKGDMLGIPGLKCHKSKVLLFVMEDAGHQLQQTINRFMKDLGITLADVKGCLSIQQVLPDSSDMLVKVNTIIRKGYQPDLIIIDNITSLAMIEQRADPQGTLVLREYRKVKRFSSWAQEHNIAMLLLAHSKKGASNSYTIADKTNSTGTQAGAVDNLGSLDNFPPTKHMGADQRSFTTESRYYRKLDVVINVGEGIVSYVGDGWDFNLSETEQEIATIILRVMDNTREDERKQGLPDRIIYVSSKEIQARLGGALSTRINQCNKLVAKGWLDSARGSDGGYTLTERASNVLHRTPVTQKVVRGG